MAILGEQESGAMTAEVCGQQGISSATFYAWKIKFGGGEPSEAKKLKALEDENVKLKRLLAEAMPDDKALKDLLQQVWAFRHRSKECPNGDARHHARGCRPFREATTR